MLAKITQLGIILENKPRSLARLCSTLGKAGVNIVALYAPERARGGKVRVWVDKPDEAKSALKTAKMRFSEEEVLAMGLDNRAGTFGEVAEKLGRAKINIKYAYSATAEGSINAVVILAVSNVSKALNVLRADTRTKQ